MLLTISASRELSMTLNRKYDAKITFDVPEFEGTYLDLIILQVYKLVHSGPRLLKPMYKSLVSVISNLAPYTKQLSKPTCKALVYLVQVFSRKEFLLEKEEHCRVLTNLMEAISYFLCYHDETNERL